MPVFVDGFLSGLNNMCKANLISEIQLTEKHHLVNIENREDACLPAKTFRYDSNGGNQHGLGY